MTGETSGTRENVPATTGVEDITAVFQRLTVLEQERIVEQRRMEQLLKQMEALTAALLGGNRGRAEPTAQPAVIVNVPEAQAAGEGVDVAGAERPDRRPTLKPQKPQPFDPSVKDSNVRTWLFSLNNYLTAAGIPETADGDKIAYAVTLLQGAALEWWRQMTLLTGRAQDPSDDVDETRRVLFQTPVGAETRASIATTSDHVGTVRSCFAGTV